MGVSRLGILAFVFGLVSVFVFILTWAIRGYWTPELYFPIGFIVLFWGFFIWRDRTFLFGLFGMRATKYGFNAGALIIMFGSIMIAANVVGYMYNEKWDVTEQKLNSLSPQTTKILATLPGDVEIIGFFLNKEAEGELRNVTKLFKESTNRVKVSFYNPQQRVDLAGKYEVKRHELAGVAIIEYEGRQQRLTDFKEEDLANALVKISRQGEKALYFVTGHGERSPDDTEPEGISFFKEGLANTGYLIRSLSLIETDVVPEDAEMVLIMGPQSSFLDGELKILESYIEKGGDIFIALDPVEGQNLGQFTEKLGIKFNNDYILDLRAMGFRKNPIWAVGLGYSQTHEITRELSPDAASRKLTLYPIASSIEKSAKMPADYAYTDLVQSSDKSLVRSKMPESLQPADLVGADLKPHTLAAAVRGKLKLANGKRSEHEFNAVVFGDSNFLTNQGIGNGFNRDLALNVVAHLAKDSGLISIRPKQPKKTQLMLTRVHMIGLFVGFVLFLPGSLLATGVALWFRRRSA